LAKIEWGEGAVRDLEKLDKQVRRRILRKLGWFAENFNRILPEPLGGEFKGVYKLRVGGWRVIYTLEGDTIVIQGVGHRREVYKLS
jgi:mRNA interferase RelE/StbE